MNVVDSSGWLEYLAGERNADFFAPAIEATGELIVPATSLFEVFQRVLQQRGEHAALQAAALMMQGQVVDLNTTLALSAGRTSGALSLPLADSAILAAALANAATLWPQDAHFERVEGVRYVAKQR